MTTEEKPCIECTELWPNDAEFFQNSRTGADLLCVCRACYRERYSNASRRSKKTASSEVSPAAMLQSFFTSLVTASQQQRKRA